jgi:hypothetical protein
MTEEQRDAYLAEIRLMSKEAEELARRIQISFHLKDGTIEVDKGEASIAAAHLQIGFLTLARSILKKL